MMEQLAALGGMILLLSPFWYPMYIAHKIDMINRRNSR